jgi:hypothetical protein
MDFQAALKLSAPAFRLLSLLFIALFIADCFDHFQSGGDPS